MNTTLKPMPRIWHTFTVRTGDLIQTAGILGGAALIGASVIHATPTAARVALLLTGWLALYLCSHAIAHTVVGRAVGIRFRAYGVRGTDHPENYPPGIRQLMSALPMWSALTDKASMHEATPRAKAAMFAAGETSTTAVSIASAAIAAHARVPGAHMLLTASIFWAIAATITVAIVAKGDYSKALRALGLRKPLEASARTRERVTGPNRRAPRHNEVRNAIIGWSIVNVVLITAWATTGAGFPWFAFVTIPSVIGVSSWARQGRREADAR